MVDYNIQPVQIPNFAAGIGNAMDDRYKFQLEMARANHLARQDEVALQNEMLKLKSARTAEANTAASKAAIKSALADSVIPLPGQAQGPQLPNLQNAQSRLALSGRFPEANVVSNTQEQFAKQKMQEGQAQEAYGKVDELTLKNEASMSAQAKDAIDMATSPDQLREMVVRLHAPDSKLASFFERNGITADRAIAEYDRMVASGMPFEQIRQMMSMGAAKTAEALDKHAKEVAGAKLDEARAEAAGQPKATGTSDERNMSILGRVLTDPSVANTPEYAQAYALISSPKLINQVGPNGEMIPVYVKRDLPTWAVPPTAGAAPTTEQPNQLPGVQATAVPSGAVANTLRMMQGGGTTAPTVNNLGAARPDLSSMVTKAAPSQVVNVTGEGQFVVNPDTGLAKPIKVEGQEAPLGRQKQAEAKNKVDALVEDMAKNYKALDEMKGMPSERAGIGANIANYAAGTHIGQEVGKALATPEQTKRNLIATAGRDLLESIKNATGMSAQEINSNFELTNMLATVTDPTQSIETIIDRLKTIAKQYGTGKFDAEKIFGKQNTAPTPAAKTTIAPPPKAVKMLKDDPSTRGHFDEIFGAGAAAKILGQ